MIWNDIIKEVILGFVGLLFSVLGVYVTYLINKYVKDQKIKDILNSLHVLVRNSVLEVYQTYVEALKDKDIFDKEAQNEALERCLRLINTNMPNDVKAWLEANIGDIRAYLINLIEAQIGSLKNSGGK